MSFNKWMDKTAFNVFSSSGSFFYNTFADFNFHEGSYMKNQFYEEKLVTLLF